jgi:hypothetical protein
MTAKATPAKLQEFIDELGTFAQTAEDTLKKIEDDLEGNKGLFAVFSERMLTIRGTAQQLGIGHVANLAALGEEIAVKGAQAATRPQIRKCVGALWDAIATIKHLLVHHDEETGEEQRILMNRLEATLKAFGGARPKATEAEIEALLKARGRA